MLTITHNFYDLVVEVKSGADLAAGLVKAGCSHGICGIVEMDAARANFTHVIFLKRKAMENRLKASVM